MNVLISWVLVVLLVISGIAVVTIATAPMLEQAKASSSLTQAEQTFSQLNDAIKSVSREGIGSSRIITVPTLEQGTWQLVPDDNIIQFLMQSSPLESAMRRIRDKLTYISGFDANCSSGAYAGKDAWIMENSYLKVYLQRANVTVDTEDNILAIESKVTGKTITPTDSSIIIDDDPTTSSGDGYSAMRTGVGMPSCIARFVINSTVSYDVFYTLYSTADFVVVEVKNIS